MSGATTPLIEEIGTHFFRTGSWTKTTALYVGFFTTLPDAAGASGVEVSGGSYARVQCGPGDSAWTAPVGGNGRYMNTSAITFPQPTADWGDVVGAGIFLASTGGTARLVSPFPLARTILNGDLAPVIPANALIINIAGGS